MESINEPGLFWHEVVAHGPSANNSGSRIPQDVEYNRPAVQASELFHSSDVLPSPEDGLSRSPGDPMFASQTQRLLPSSRLSSPRTRNHFGMAHTSTTYEGMTANMLYRGSLGTRFPWHVEDSMLPSVSYCQWGKAKVW